MLQVLSIFLHPAEYSFVKANKAEFERLQSPNNKSVRFDFESDFDLYAFAKGYVYGGRLVSIYLLCGDIYNLKVEAYVDPSDVKLPQESGASA